MQIYSHFRAHFFAIFIASVFGLGSILPTLCHMSQVNVVLYDCIDSEGETEEVNTEFGEDEAVFCHKLSNSTDPVEIIDISGRTTNQWYLVYLELHSPPPEMAVLT